MYNKSIVYLMKESCSSLFDNLNVLYENDSDVAAPSGLSFVTAHKKHVNVVHCEPGGKTIISQVSIERDAPIIKSPVMQVKWCKLSGEDFLAIANHKGVLVFDDSGKLLMFWHSPKANDDDDQSESVSTYCRGIASVADKYICVGTFTGNVLVITNRGNAFGINETLTEHSTAITALSSSRQPTDTKRVDFVSADSLGTICCYTSGAKFTLRTCVTGTSDVCTSIELLANGLVVAGYLSGHMRVFDSATSSLLAEIAAHVRAVSTLDATCDGESKENTVISGSEDSFLRVWKMSREDTIQVTHEWCTSITDTQICGAKFCDPQGKSFLVSGYDSREVLRFDRTS